MVKNVGRRWATSDKVVCVTVDSDMVENVGVAVGISTIPHSVPDIQFTSGLEAAILKYDGRLTSRIVRRCQLRHRCFGHIENIWVVEGILLNDARIRFSAKFHDFSAILAAILDFGRVT